MKNFVIYCKSYSGDIERALCLKESIEKYNKENIPFFICVPQKDIQLFKNKLGTENYELIENEATPVKLFDKDFGGFNKGYLNQQIIKSNFWKLDICNNYACLDSDSYFIRDFLISDFMYNNETPYTVMHEDKEFWIMMHRNGKSNIKEIHNQRAMKIREFISGNKCGRLLNYGMTPVIWSRKVWETMENDFLISKGLEFIDLIKMVPYEFNWYGEWLLHSKAIDIIAIEPLFKAFHYKEQYDEYRKLGTSEETISNEYLGILMQSNFNSPNKYQDPGLLNKQLF